METFWKMTTANRAEPLRMVCATSGKNLRVNYGRGSCRELRAVTTSLGVCLSGPLMSRGNGSGRLEADCGLMGRRSRIWGFILGRWALGDVSAVSSHPPARVMTSLCGGPECWQERQALQDGGVIDGVVHVLNLRTPHPLHPLHDCGRFWITFTLHVYRRLETPINWSVGSWSLGSAVGSALQT